MLLGIKNKYERWSTNLNKENRCTKQLAMCLSTGGAGRSATLSIGRSKRGAIILPV